MPYCVTVHSPFIAIHALADCYPIPIGLLFNSYWPVVQFLLAYFPIPICLLLGLNYSWYLSMTHVGAMTIHI